MLSCKQQPFPQHINFGKSIFSLGISRNVARLNFSKFLFSCKPKTLNSKIPSSYVSHSAQTWIVSPNCCRWGCLPGLPRWSPDAKSGFIQPQNSYTSHISKESSQPNSQDDWSVPRARTEDEWCLIPSESISQIEAMFSSVLSQQWIEAESWWRK